MNSYTTKLLGSLMLGLCLGATSGCGSFMAAMDANAVKDNPGSRTFGARMDDESVETKAIININAADPAFKTSHINVVSYNGYVLLAGQVATAELKQKATDVLRDIQKVRRIYNELEVSGNSSSITRSSDTWITAKIKSILLASPETEGNRVKVVTENGVVYLMGLASQSEAERIADKASEVGGVQKVVRLFEYYD